MRVEQSEQPLSNNHSNLQLYLIALAVAIVSAMAGIGLWKVLNNRQPPSTAALIVLPEPREIKEFELTDQHGRPFTLENLRQRWTLVFFGFTHCPDVCPSTLYDLQLVHDEIMQESDPANPPHQVLFVSVDPERDTPQRLGNYLAYFSPDFIGVTGDHSQLGPFSMNMSIAYRIGEHAEGDMAYSVDHSASILLIEPSGRMHGVFPAPHDAQAISTDLAKVID